MSRHGVDRVDFLRDVPTGVVRPDVHGVSDDQDVDGVLEVSGPGREGRPQILRTPLFPGTHLGGGGCPRYSWGSPLFGHSTCLGR